MKKRVLISINDFLVGGAQKLIASQLLYFNKEKYDIELVSLFEFKARKDLYHLIPSSIKVHRIGMKSAYDIKGLLNIAILLFSFRPHTVVSHLFLSNTLLRIFKVIFWYRVITVEHNTYTNKRRWQVFMDRMLSGLSYKIIAVSEEVREFTITQQKLNESKCITIQNGIDLKPIKELKKDLTKEEARRKLSLPLNKKIFLSVARLTSQKNHSLLIESFSFFVKQHKDVILLIAGEGELRSSLEEKVKKLDLEESVFFLGAVKDIYTYYRASDFLVSTSLIEGMSMSYLEALAFGLPLIATETGGTKMLLKEGQNGIYIRSLFPEDSAQFLEKILGYNYPLMSKFSENISEDCSIEKNVLKFEKLL